MTTSKEEICFGQNIQGLVISILEFYGTPYLSGILKAFFNEMQCNFVVFFFGVIQRKIFQSLYSVQELQIVCHLDGETCDHRRTAFLDDNPILSVN